MGWSVKAVFCGDSFFGYIFRAIDGLHSPGYCAVLQQKAASKQVNEPGHPYVVEMHPEEIFKLADKEGFISSGPDIGSHHCVPLVKAVAPGLGATAFWRAGVQVTSINAKTLTSGTIIGYGFDENGKYPSHKTGNHAAIFVSAEGDQMTVIDQWFGQPARSHSVPINTGKPDRVWVIVTREKTADK